jgi:hypothetical protein
MLGWAINCISLVLSLATLILLSSSLIIKVSPFIWLVMLMILFSPALQLMLLSWFRHCLTLSLIRILVGLIFF